jgi:hypothetical protein
MDGFEVILGAIGLASVTTWLVIRNAKEHYLSEMSTEILCLAISWFAALIISYEMLHLG